MSKQSLIEDTKIKKSGSRNEFGSYSLMTLKQFSASKTIASNFGIKFDQPIKEEFRPATAKLNNNSSNNIKRTSEVSKYSFILYKLEPFNRVIQWVFIKFRIDKYDTL